MNYPPHCSQCGKLVENFIDGTITASGVTCFQCLQRMTQVPKTPAEDHPLYRDLQRVLDDAFEQAASGKGKERHANGKPFTEQPIMEIARMVGLPGHLFQICKKVQEAGGMASRGTREAAKRELLGAIVYCAAAVLLLEEQENEGL
jgi:hypothetical protein